MNLDKKHLLSSDLEPRFLPWIFYSMHIHWELEELWKIFYE